MNLNLLANQTFGSFPSMNSQQAKTQGLKIREKKLQTKYKQLIQKHQTMKKFAPNCVTQLDVEEVDDQGNQLLQQHRGGDVNETKTGRVVSSYLKSEKDEGRFKKRQYQFLTARDFMQKSTSRNKISLRPSLIKSTSHKSKPLIQTQLKSPAPPSHPEQPPYQSPTHQNLQTRQFLHNLDTQPTCYSNLWQKFMKSVKQIQLNQQELCLGHVSEKDRKIKLTNDFMKEMEFMLEQQDRMMLEVVMKLGEVREIELKEMYLRTHELHGRLTSAKVVIGEHVKEYQYYLNTIKNQDKQRKLMLQSKREFSLSKPHSHDNSPLRHIHKDLNLNQKDLKQLMQKKSKLNLQLDLSYQIQQRKKIAKQKETFNMKKSKLDKDKAQIQGKMKQVKQKIQFKEKQAERYEFQKDKYMREVEYFLKMLLRNPEYRLDGAVWTFRKMIEYGFEPQISDFAEVLDLSARSFLMEEFRIMKQQKIYTAKPIESKKNRLMMSRKVKKTPNRQRVKSVIVNNTLQQNSKPINIHDDLNPNAPPNFSDNAFFTFGCKNLAVNQAPNLSIRKKSGSLTLMKTYDESLGQTQSNDAKIQTTRNSFHSLTKQNNRNKLYFSAKKYIKNWIGEKGWNMFTARTVRKVQDNKDEEKFISEQKARAKHKFFKIGRSNTRYNSIVKTLYGSQEDLKAQNKRVKTCHE